MWWLHNEADDETPTTLINKTPRLVTQVTVAGDQPGGGVGWGTARRLIQQQVSKPASETAHVSGEVLCDSLGRDISLLHSHRAYRNQSLFAAHNTVAKLTKGPRMSLELAGRVSGGCRDDAVDVRMTLKMSGCKCRNETVGVGVRRRVSE